MGSVAGVVEVTIVRTGYAFKEKMRKKFSEKGTDNTSNCIKSVIGHGLNKRVK
jgi:hypothetical protein